MNPWGCDNASATCCSHSYHDIPLLFSTAASAVNRYNALYLYRFGLQDTQETIGQQRLLGSVLRRSWSPCFLALVQVLAQVWWKDYN